MGVTVFYLLVLQKYTSSKQNNLTKKYALCLGNISKDFFANNIKKTKKTKRIKWVCVRSFC